MKAFITLSIIVFASKNFAQQENAENLEAGARTGTQLPPLAFNPRLQLVDVSGEHEFRPPGKGDERGPCPGLNALANHNYLPRNGVGSIQQFIEATNRVYGLGIDIGTILAVYGSVFVGDLTKWSIGGPSKDVKLPGVQGLLNEPKGLSFSHNKYEGDSSPTRGDLYLFGDAARLQMSQFKDLYFRNTKYDLDMINAFHSRRFEQSKRSNPYFFRGPLTGVVVTPAAYFFIFRLMANRTAEHPEGILTRNVLKSFFGVTGDDKNLRYFPGHERIPHNWYRRAIGNEYTNVFFATDLLKTALKYPKFLSIGGNTGTTNSMTLVDPANITGGLYNVRNLRQGNNAACFGIQFAQLAMPDLLKDTISDLTKSVLETVNTLVQNATADLKCPQLKTYSTEPFNKYPGYTKSL